MSNNAPSPAPGWYPAAHANGEQRYWDGAQWTDWTPESAAAAQQAATVGDISSAAPASVDTLVAPAEPPARKKGLRWWAWVLIGLGALIILMIIIGSVNGGGRGSVNDDPDTQPAASQEAEDEPEDTKVDTPSVVGLSVAEARAALEGAGMVVKITDGTGDDWIVISQTISVPTDPGTEIMIVAEAPKPVYTLAQQNAIGTAQDYLDFSGFSRTGLISQLEYEGFSAEDATFGADNAGADWNAEAAEAAADYLEYSSFSRQGLYDQLAYEGFTDAEIQYALAQVGY